MELLSKIPMELYSESKWDVTEVREVWKCLRLCSFHLFLHSAS